MIQVELADPAITVHGWMPAWDYIGKYKLRIRKTPEELKQEKQRLKERFGTNAPKVNPMRFEDHTVIEHAEGDPSTVFFLPGLWPRVKSFFDQHDIKYEIIADNRNPAIRPPIDYEAIKDVEFRETQDLALALVATSDCGIIETTTSYGKSWLISVICKAFPTLRILICTSSTQVVNTLYEYLCKQVPGQVGIVMGGKERMAGKRIVVSTLRSVSKIPVEDIDLLLCDEAHAVGHTQSGEDLMKFCFCRRFGFTASPIRNDGSQLALESIFGPTILKMSYDEAVQAGMVTPMKYTMLHCDWCPSICYKEDVSEVIMKRFAYWRNSARNRAVAQFVQDLHKADKNAQILIMAATLEHVVQIHMLLPWFVPAYYGDVDLEDLKRKFPKEKYPNFDPSKYKMKQKDLDRVRGAFAKGTLRFVVSTTVFREGCNFVHLRALVRVDGATSKVLGIQIPGRLARLDEDKDFGYLIDIDDDFCAWARRRAISRETLYNEQQWQRITPEEVLNDFRTKATADNTDNPGWDNTEELQS